jgi:hydroxypyruvate isomerase
VRFAANISTLFRDVAFLERPSLAAAAGFGGVEFWWPSGIPLGELERALKQSRLEVALMNFDGGDLDRGDRGLLSSPRTVDVFREHVPAALEFARAVGCRRLNALVGLRDPSVALGTQRELAVESLRWAADQAAQFGMQILVEPINARDVPSYLVATTAAAVELIAAVERPNVKLQYDCYHAQRGEGNLIETLRQHADVIGHVQIADSPGRNQPGTGEINFLNVLRALAATGYDGYVGLEYVPDGSVEDSLAWLPRQSRDADIGRVANGCEILDALRQSSGLSALGERRPPLC